MFVVKTTLKKCCICFTIAVLPMFITVENTMERGGHTEQKNQCGPINGSGKELSKTIRPRNQFQCGENTGGNPNPMCHYIRDMFYWCWIVRLTGLRFAVHPSDTAMKPVQNETFLYVTCLLLKLVPWNCLLNELLKNADFVYHAFKRKQGDQIKCT